MEPGINDLEFSLHLQVESVNDVKHNRSPK